MIVPIKEKHILYEGVTWEWVYQVNTPPDDDNPLGIPVNLSGCTGRLVAKKSNADTTKLIDVTASFSPTAGQVKFTIPATTTVGATWKVITFDAKLYWPDGVTIDILAYGSMTLDTTATPPTDPA